MADAAWRAWRSGDLRKAGELAAGCLGHPKDGLRCRHIELLLAHVRGRHRKVVALFRSMRTLPEDPPHAARVAMESFVHLGRYAEALWIAKKGQPGSFLVARLQKMVDRPLEVELDRVTVIPFVSGGPLDRFFPGIRATINGRKVVARLDTGGTFLVMSPTDASRLGVKTVCGGVGQHAFFKASVCGGTADRFVMGGAVLRHVPVSTLSTLKPDTIIFGTNVLMRFLATLDYPAGRMILSRRGKPVQRTAHLKTLKPAAATVPFYMWGDHFMFAHGRLGRHRNLVFFVDSGLVAVTMFEGTLRQAGFTTSKEAFVRLGLNAVKATGPFLLFNGPIGLGAVEQKGVLVYHNPKAWKELAFGGIRMDGLISHAFLSRYQWTVDFDRYEYRFAP